MTEEDIEEEEAAAVAMAVDKKWKSERGSSQADAENEALLPILMNDERASLEPH